jgi:hypothetical protein
MPAPHYDPPVDRLLALGEPSPGAADRVDYVALGLTRDHLPALVRMASDPLLDRSPDAHAVWAPVHAWRALGQLGDAAAAAPLLDRLRDVNEDDDYALTELPAALALLGPDALPALTTFLGRREVDPFARGGAAEAIAAVGRTHPELRATAVGALADALAHHAVQHRDLNSLVVGALLDLQAAEAAHVIEQAFAAGDVDPAFVGDWEDVQVTLGLLDARLTPRPDHFAQSGVSLPDVRAELRRTREHEQRSAAGARRAASSRKAAKARRQQAAQSRRRNRRK